MNYIFGNCKNLEYIDLTNFNTNNAILMEGMFYYCSKLTSINLSKFNTLSSTTMKHLFNGCYNVTILDLESFKTDNVEDMSFMFCNCTSLNSLVISNFKTLNVINMESMFENCENLINLDLSQINTNSVKNMKSLFRKFYSLNELDLSSFNTNNVVNMAYMFDSWINLEYLNLYNVDERQLFFYDDMLFGVPENIFICIKENITESKIIQQISSKKCHIIYFSDDWKSKQKKIIAKTNECIESCANMYEYNGKCLESCQKGLFYNEESLNKCQCELDKCLICPRVALYKNLCTKCNVNYYPKENDLLNIREYINCYNYLEGYYLDKNIYKLCYHTCRKFRQRGQ